MIIDASLGRAGCCGFPSCSRPQPFPPVPGPGPMPGPNPPFGPDEPSALSIQLTTAQTGIAPGAVLPLGASVRQFGDDLRYDAANHAVVVNRPGIYAFTWQVLVQSAEAVGDVVVSLQSLEGTAVLGSSGALAVPTEDGVLISGAAVGRLRPGSAWALVNNSGAAISLPAAGTVPAAFVGAMTVTALDSAQDGFRRTAPMSVPQTGLN